MARAMADSYQFLEENVSPVVSDWKWGNVHENEYVNGEWSHTSLRIFFDRQVAIGGSGNTLKVSKVSLLKLRDKKSFKSGHT